MEYEVTATKTFHYTVTVEAASDADADELVYGMIDIDNVAPDSEDIEITGVAEVVEDEY